eukprot:3812692-Amphidinium_carterae.1
MDDKYRRTTGLNFEDPKLRGTERSRPILGDRQGVDAVDGTFLYNISKSLTGNGRLNGVEDGWIDIRTAAHGHSSRNVLLAMMQGEKP